MGGKCMANKIACGRNDNLQLQTMTIVLSASMLGKANFLQAAAGSTKQRSLASSIGARELQAVVVYSSLGPAQNVHAAFLS